MNSVSWDDFRLVKAIADQRSLGGAAEMLNVNNSTVFRRLNSLEEQLGVRLFERARSGYLLTSAGEEMVGLAGRMSESIVEFERRIAGQDVRPSGELRVTTTDTIFSHLVAPMFCAFRTKYPEITLDFVIENRALNLSRRDADVAIRASVDPPQTLVGRRVASLAWAVFASEGLLRESGLNPANASPFKTGKARWIGFGDPIQGTSGGRWMTSHIPQELIGVKVNTIATLSTAVESGLGVGVLPCFMRANMRNVVRIAGLGPEADTGLWVLTHPDLKRAARVRAFLEFFGAELAKRRKLIEGEDD
jgi:DNA-binding transcriptional LysR family regulator